MSELRDEYENEFKVGCLDATNEQVTGFFKNGYVWWLESKLEKYKKCVEELINKDDMPWWFDEVVESSFE